ncbi:MAG: hypothetical protein HY815_20885 [Candidatus Riflebacteria bacterium]|nr:hypothetical protein [Candidatus Riflebacteria bacterium]
MSWTADFHRRVATLTIVMWIVVTVLSLKTALDVLGSHRQFPGWFAPTFALGVVGLVSVSGLMALTLRASRALEPRSDWVPRVIWPLLSLSFVCTTAVHGFHPFRLPLPVRYGSLDIFMKLNLALAVGGFVTTAAFGALYLGGRREGAILGWLLASFLVLVPNDTCRNGFNLWWLDTVGASPLMYLPNLYATLFGVCALVGVRSTFCTAMVAAACGGVTLLGVGHMTRLIW